VEILAPPEAREFPPQVPASSGVSIVIVVEDLRTKRADVARAVRSALASHTVALCLMFEQAALAAVPAVVG
jgi:hypothetical protein